MGQKINPILLRLQHTNKFFDSCWYSSFFYTNLLHQDLKTQSYLNGILKQLQYPSGRFCIQYIPKKSKINIFFCSIKNLQILRFKFFQMTKTGKYKLKNNEEFFNKNVIKNYQYYKQKYMFYLFLNVKYENLYFLQKQFCFRILLILYLQIKNNNKFLAKNLLLHKIKRILLFNNFEKITMPLCESFIKKNLIENSNNHNSIKNRTKNLLTSQKFLKKNSLNFSKNLQDKLILLPSNKKHLNDINIKYKQSLTSFYKKLKYFFNEKKCMSIKKPVISLANTLKKFNANGLVLIKKTSFNDSLKLLNFNIKKYKKLNKDFLVKNFLFREHIESIISNKFNTNTNIFIYKSINDYQSAMFLADQIVYYIEKRVTFRKIKSYFFKQADNHKFIKGIRISFSGRVGGKSKKAQKAKTECIKYGQTSLHVFSEKIDFASKNAFTPFGLIGIKVWVCYY